MRYKSKFEAAVAPTLPKGTKYEATTVPYTLECNYTPDWRVPTDGKRLPIWIETTGKLDYDKRRKLLAVQRHHPAMDLRLCFQRDNRLSKKAKMTYGQWATKHGFKWSVFPALPLTDRERGI